MNGNFQNLSSFFTNNEAEGLTVKSFGMSILFSLFLGLINYWFLVTKYQEVVLVDFEFNPDQTQTVMV